MSRNPADLASRGAKVESFFRADFWLSGPKFLVKPDDDPEVKPVVSVNAVQAR